MCTVSSIVLLLTLIEHDMVFLSFTISLQIHYTNKFHYLNYKTITIVTHGNRNIIFNSNAIELTVHTSCYCGLRLTLCYLLLFMTCSVSYLCHRVPR